jgi:chitin disaccharide deacetylase
MKIIINADDFGLSEEINETIIYCLLNGLITSTSILSNAPASDQAIKYLKDNEKLDIGIHLALDGPFNLSHNNSLIDKKTGYFFDNKSAIHKLYGFNYKYNDLIEEYSLQIEKLLDQGLRISHIDHHHHLHLYPMCLLAVINIKKKYRIKIIRPQWLVLPINYSLFKYSYRYLHNLVLKWTQHSIDGYFELVLDNNSNFEDIYRRLRKLLGKKYLVIEIVVHPQKKSDRVIQFLKDKRTVELLSKHQLINYCDV